MERTYYTNGEYRCPRCGALMIPSGGVNEWECTECDILGIETWLDKEKTGYLEVDIEAYEAYLEQAREEEEAWFKDQITLYQSAMLNEEQRED